jgi:hypothetical protein
MWFYKLWGVIQGPVEDATIFELLEKNRLSTHSRIKTDPNGIWQRIEDTNLYLIFRSNRVKTIASSAIEYRKRFDLQKQKNLFIVWISMMLVILAGIVFRLICFFVGYSTSFFELSFHNLSFWAFMLVFISSVIMTAILLYQFWKIIQDGYEKITPGQAIAQALLPCENIFGAFRAFFGFSINANRFIDRHFTLKPTNGLKRSKKGFSLIYSYTSIIWNFFYFEIFISWIELIINQVRGDHFFTLPISYLSLLEPYLGTILIFGAISLVVYLVMFTDFYITTRSILKAVEAAANSIPQ